ncbi:hypothetical protein FVE85_0442 [Porphyridium purpureum]|uniref:Uncharacterized protein n=1 Tax=Porphyridium purpureum TaxID=35688 RepID=A0A5J4Z1F3_PORPP|nr:hypothetical protein FVE85_0442 [Porphyridium purpureum]|eukprot:POR0672..scf208_2
MGDELELAELRRSLKDLQTGDGFEHAWETHAHTHTHAVTPKLTRAGSLSLVQTVMEMQERASNRGSSHRYSSKDDLVPRFEDRRCGDDDDSGLMSQFVPWQPEPLAASSAGQDLREDENSSTQLHLARNVNAVQSPESRAAAVEVTAQGARGSIRSEMGRLNRRRPESPPSSMANASKDTERTLAAREEQCASDETAESSLQSDPVLVSAKQKSWSALPPKPTRTGSSGVSTEANTYRRSAIQGDLDLEEGAGPSPPAQSLRNRGSVSDVEKELMFHLTMDREGSLKSGDKLSRRMSSESTHSLHERKTFKQKIFTLRRGKSAHAKDRDIHASSDMATPDRRTPQKRLSGSSSFRKNPGNRSGSGTPTSKGEVGMEGSKSTKTLPFLFKSSTHKDETSNKVHGVGIVRVPSARNLARSRSSLMSSPRDSDAAAKSPGISGKPLSQARDLSFLTAIGLLDTLRCLGVALKEIPRSTIEMRDDYTFGVEIQRRGSSSGAKHKKRMYFLVHVLAETASSCLISCSADAKRRSDTGYWDVVDLKRLIKLNMRRVDPGSVQDADHVPTLRELHQARSRTDIRASPPRANAPATTTTASEQSHIVIVSTRDMY